MIRLLCALSLLPALALAIPQIEVQSESPESLVLRIRFDEPVYDVVERGEGRYLDVSLDGATVAAEPGAPSVPQFSRLLAVPDGLMAEVEVLSVERESVPYHQRLAHALRPRRHCGGSGRDEDAPRDEKAFARAAEPLVALSEPSYLGPISVALLTVTPFERQGERLANFVKRVDLKVHFKGPRVMSSGPVSSGAIDESTLPFYSSLVVNPSNLPPAGETTFRKVDLIISPKRYESSLTALVKFKEDQGRHVRLHYLDRKPTTAEVKSIIESEYAQPVPPSHTILVGSVDEIPSYRRSDYWTDYPYALLDSGDYPDLSIARLPVQSDAELKSFIAKIVSRERESRDNGAVLVTSGYETNWCHLNLKFIMESIFAGSAVPLNITKLYASEGAGTDRVLNAYNANPNFIVYDGHGNAKGMTEIPLLIQHLPRLKNRVYPILFDIACLNSYWPAGGATPRNFADSIGPLEGAGVAGILAASHNSGGHDLFRHIFRASIFDEQSTSEPFHGINEIGSAVLYGKIKYLEQFNGAASALTDNHLFYYHGDPASTLFAL